MPHVPATVVVIALSCLALLGGCDRPRDEDPALAAMEAVHGTAAWQGRLPCADCEAIETRLVLERRDDGERLYALEEVYVAAADTEQFRESGEWHLDDVVLSLESQAGGVRRYGLVHGGALQVRDPRGRVYPGREHDLLLPAGYP